MTSRQNQLGSAKRWASITALAALVMVLSTWALPSPARAQDQPKEYGIAAKRPVLQASCRHCPWGALGDILKTIMAPAYDVAICYGCSGENGARYVSKRLMSAEISDRLFAQGVSTRPDAPVDFGITQSERTRDGYQKRMIIIALTTVPHTAADAAATRMSAARKPQQMSRPSSSI